MHVHMAYFLGCRRLIKEGSAVLGPGQYLPDASEGITRPEDLPPAQIVPRSRNHKTRPCPHCGRSCVRHGVATRILHDLGDLVSGRPRDIHLVYARHRCRACRAIFNVTLADYAAPKAHYTQRAVALAVRLVVEDGLPYQAASWHLWRDHRVFVPFATIQNWVEAGGKKSGPANVDNLSRLGPG